MQPTVSPWAWVSSWDRRARTRAAGEYARSRDRARAREHEKYAFYGLKKDSRHFVRLDPIAKGLLLNRQWVTSAPVTWRVDRFHDSEPWAVPDIKNLQNYRPYEPVSIVLPGETGVQGPALSHSAAGAPRTIGPIAHSWSYGARSWVTGAVILALLVLLIRVAENCLHKKLFRAIYAHTNMGAGELQQNEMRPGHYRLQGVRRQESDEWSTPNVLATSLQLQHRDFDAGSIPRLEDMEARPPPYSACAPHKAGEEPPPPYSACYVAYTCPKTSDPQVHIRRQNLPDERQHTSTDIDNAQNDLIENRLRAESVTATSSEETAERTELVFDNGRIVERPSLEDDDTGGVSNDNVEESTRRGEVLDKVVYIDETASESTTPERALRV